MGSISRNLPIYGNDIGAAELVGSFTDPDFDPAQKAFWYARAIKIPTPRWTLYDSVKFKVQMGKEVLPASRFLDRFELENSSLGWWPGDGGSDEAIEVFGGT